jgi:D-alanyl-D-alanine carboxypeptidase (penicillin-binding protein 5/6)
MASAAKIVTALVVLDSRPLKPDGAGPTVVISSEDYRNYIDFGTSDARTVAVFPGETWTQRELLEAMILGSSNNHAETLARWAFGSAEGYLDAAGRWLHTNGLTGTDVVDATGLSDASAGTATDLAHLAGLASTNPIISDILANPASALTSRRGVNNTTSYLPEEGVTGISRSYTDAAGVCFLFSARIGDGDDAFTFSGAFIGEPDHDTLETDVLALMGSAREGVHDQPILAEGDPYALLETAWGERTAAVVGVTKSQVGWQTGARDDVQVAVEDIRTGRAGKPVGRVATTIDGETVSAPLVLEKTIRDPGPGWRLLNPVPLISALVESSR